MPVAELRVNDLAKAAWRTKQSWKRLWNWCGDWAGAARRHGRGDARARRLLRLRDRPGDAAGHGGALQRPVVPGCQQPSCGSWRPRASATRRAATARPSSRRKDMLAKLRMDFAGKGMPTGGGVGYEIFDKGDAFSSTSFVQNINQLRALEGELSRTIRSISPRAGRPRASRRSPSASCSSAIARRRAPRSC